MPDSILPDTRNIFQKTWDSIMNSSTVRQAEFARTVTNNPPDYSTLPITQPNNTTIKPLVNSVQKTYSSTPTPQPQQSSGGLTADLLRSKFGFNDQNTINNILNDPSQRARYEAELGNSSGNNLNGEIDSIYAPLNQTYDNYLGELEKQRPIAIEEANNASISAQNELDRSLGQYAQNRDNAQQTLQDQYSSAYSNAIREYNTLKQGAMNRFGGGSSTGAAVSDLLGQETLRGTGGLRKTMMEGITQAFQYFDNANKFVNDKKFELQKAQATELKKINSLYDQKRAEIQARKFETESARQAAKVDVLRQQLADSQALANQKYAAELELNMWREQVKTQLQNNLAKNAETVLSVPKINNVQFSGYDNQAPSQSSQVPTRTTYDSKSTLLSDSELQGNTFTELFDIFA